LKKALVLVAVVVSQTPTTAYPISRVGNRHIGDSRSGALLQVDARFPVIEEPAPGFVRLVLPGPARVKVNGGDLATLYTEFMGLARHQQASRLQASGWTPRPATSACVDVYERQSGRTITTLVFWGRSQGFAFVGPASPAEAKAVRRTVASLTLSNPECGWQ